MPESTALKFKLRSALSLATELEKELENKETLLTETSNTLESIQDLVGTLMRRIQENDDDEAMV